MKDWKKTFWELYRTEDDMRIAEALTLKQNNIPRFLYRYRSINSTESLTRVKDEIETGKIFLANPKSFNDIYDSVPMLYHSQIEEYDHDKELCKKHFKKVLTKEEYNEVFDSEDWFEKLFDVIAGAESSAEEKETYKSDFRTLFLWEIEKLNNQIKQWVQDYNKIACFTVKSNNLPMWYHYGNKYSGVCLEYDTDKIENVIIINRLFPVLYKDVLEDCAKRLMGHPGILYNFMDFVPLQKLSDWSYEQEWRLVMNIGQLGYPQEYVKDPRCAEGVLFSFCKPSKILLGSQVTKENEAYMREIAAEKQIGIEKMVVTSHGIEFISLTK